MVEKYHIKLKAISKINGYQPGETVEFYNEIFNRSNGIAFFPIDKEFEIVFTRQFIKECKGFDLYEGDKVLVKGTKKIGEYETHIIKSRFGFTLKENKTMLNDDAALIGIIKVIGHIYED